MLFIFTIAGAAALAVVAYTRLRTHSPETAAAVTRAVRELAAIIFVCSKAAEGIVDALQAGARPQPATYTPATSSWHGAARPLVDTWQDFDDD